MLNLDTSQVSLSREEMERFSRHLILPEVGLEGQKRLKAGKVLCIGTGGLGSPLLLYLAAAGVGRIGIVDFDVVDTSNLQRQIIHSTSAVGKPKVESAKQRILEINPYCQVDVYNTALKAHNALDLFRDYDVIVDGTDNFPTRYLVNDACVILGKPNVYGSIFRFEGQATVFNYQGGPHYRDLYPEPPPPGLVPSCAEGGVLGILPGIIGVIQATETVKILLGIGTTLSGRLLLYDALKMSFRELKLRKNPATPPVTELIDYEQFCGIPAVTDTPAVEEITVHDLKARMDAGQDFVLVDVRNPNEYDLCRIPGSVLIPLPEIEQGPGVEKVRAALNGSELIVHCKSGMRSAKALGILAQAGIKGKNLKGGILAWGDAYDPSVPKY
ncbi:MAG: molybdopterin-synthase adenylyltransferase MoeB [Thermostichales cyanobacterium BF4_bins_65]